MKNVEVAEVHSCEESGVGRGRGRARSSFLGNPSAKFLAEKGGFGGQGRKWGSSEWAAREEKGMKGTRHTEEQIITILKQGEAGLGTAELCRQHGITEQTYYRWKAKYGGMDSSEAKKLKQLEDENRKLKHVVAELTLDNRALKDVLSKNW